MKLWNFLDYVDPSGMNVIEQWLWKLPMDARLEINTRIQYLTAVKRFQRPYTASLSGACDGLFELRIKSANVQYRPLFCYGPGRHDVTILFGAIEKGGRFEPLSACEIARQRLKEIREVGRTCEHSFAEPEAGFKEP